MIRLNTPDGVKEVSADLVQRFEAGDPMRVPDPPVLDPDSLVTQPLPLQPSAASRETRRLVTTPVDTHALIRAAAKKHGVKPALVRSIIAAESAFRPDAVSEKGAIGLMQLMPSTAQLFGADPHIPEQNVDAGTQYLKLLIAKYQHYRDWLKRVIAAYNAGPGAVDRYHGVPPFPETRVYVARVLSYLRMFQRSGS